MGNQLCPGIRGSVQVTGIVLRNQKMRKITFILAVVFVIAALTGIGFFTISGKKSGNKESVAGNNALCKNCNVILLSVDSLRADHIGAFGYPRDTTPNFDTFTKKGALFLNYFTTSFLTPVTEMSVHTGLYPTAHGTTNFDTILPQNRKTIAEHLKNKGYKTSAILSSPEFFETNPALKQSFSRGFDNYEYLEARQLPPRERVSSELDSLGDKKFFLWLPIGVVHWPYGENSENIYADRSYDGILKNKTLDWTVFQDIYQGIVYPSYEESLAAEYARSNLANSVQTPGALFGNIYQKLLTPNTRELQATDVQYVRDKYDNGVRAFDAFFGQLIGELERRNLLSNTIVIVESEHGEDLGEHGYFAHYDVLDTQIHTPLFIFVPTIQKESKISSLVSPVDVFPTIIDLLDDDTVSHKIQGKSLVPLIDGREQDGLRQKIFTERNPLWEEAHKGIRTSLENSGIKVVSGKNKDIAIRTPEWKYILRTARDRVERISWWKTLTGKPVVVPEAELYDLISDPGETNNVIDMRPDVAASLRTELEDWYKEISADAPPKVERVQEIQPYF